MLLKPPAITQSQSSLAVSGCHTLPVCVKEKVVRSGPWPGHGTRRLREKMHFLFLLSASAPREAAALNRIATQPCLVPGESSSFFVPAGGGLGAPPLRHCLTALSPGACYEVRVSLPAWVPLGVRVSLEGGSGAAGAEEKLQFCAGASGAPPSAVALTFPRRGPAPLAAAGATPYDVRLDELYWGVLPAVALRMAAPLALAATITAAAALTAALSAAHSGARARQRRTDW